jgi:hypothetical protein
MRYMLHQTNTRTYEYLNQYVNDPFPNTQKDFRLTKL